MLNSEATIWYHQPKQIQPNKLTYIKAHAQMYRRMFPS
jgi:hypothetical protein